MQAAKIRHILISFCLSVFLFHIYMISIYNTNYLQSKVSTFKAAYRGIAAEAVTCSFSTLSLEKFISSSHRSSNCEKILTLKLIPETKDVAVKLYVKKGGTYLVYPSVGEDRFLVSDVEIGDGTISALGASPKIQTETKKMLSEQLPILIKELLKTEVKDKVALNSKKPIDLEVNVPSFDNTEASFVDTDIATNINASDKDKIKKIFLKTDNLIKKNNHCLLSADNAETLDEIIIELKESLNVDRKITTFSSSVRNHEIRSLNQEKIEEILDLSEDLDEISNEENSFDSVTKLSCFSRRAVKGTADEQYILYMENIRPLLSAALDGSSSPEESTALLTAINTDSSFKNLQNSNENIKNIFQIENLAASAVLACSSQVNKTLCIQEIKEDVVKLETAQAQKQNNIILNDSIVIYKEWLSKLAMETQEEDNGKINIVDQILKGTGHKTSVITPTINNTQDEILEVARKANERLNKMAKSLEFGADARSRVIAPHKGSIPMLGDEVIYNQSRSLE